MCFNLGLLVIIHILIILNYSDLDYISSNCFIYILQRFFKNRDAPVLRHATDTYLKIIKEMLGNLGCL